MALKNIYIYGGAPAEHAHSYDGVLHEECYTGGGDRIEISDTSKSIFEGKRWAFCGDSNFDPTGVYKYYVGTSDDGSHITEGIHAQQYIDTKIEGLSSYLTNESGVYYAAGGRGIIRNFESEIAAAQRDIDVLMVITSPNDWQAVNNNISGVPFDLAHGYGTHVYDSDGRTALSGMKIVIDHCVNASDDSYAAGDLTVAGRLNDLLTTFYNRFYVNGPGKARICFLNGMPYPIGTEKADPYGLKGYMSNKGYVNICKLLEAVIADWLEIDKLGCRTLGWLIPSTLQTYHVISLQKTAARTYKTIDNGLVSIPYIVEKDTSSPYYGRTIEPWRMVGLYDDLVDSNGNHYVFAPYYLPYNTSQTTTNARGDLLVNTNVVPWGHYGYRLHVRFLAPLIAHFLGYALSPSLTTAEIDNLLPESLKFNNL